MGRFTRSATLASVVVALALCSAACSGPDHSAEHDAVVAGLPEIPGTELIDTQRSTHCEKDWCPLGDDAMTSTYTYRVSESGPDERELIAMITNVYPDAETQYCETLDTDAERCVFEFDHRASASFDIDDWSVHVDTLSWADGTYTVHLRDQ